MSSFPAYINQNYYLDGNGVKVRRVQGVPQTDDGIIFTNEFYNTPLYREPNNGAVYKLLLEQYKAKNCVYESAGDTNGLAYWMGTNYGSSAWSNPALSYTSIYCNFSSSVTDLTTYQQVDGNSTDLFNRTNSTTTTENNPESYLFISWSGNERLYISGIYLKSPNVETYGFLKSWLIRIFHPSDYAKNVQINFENDNRLTGVNSDIYVPIEGGNFPCNTIEIKQTGLNSIGTNHLALGEIELYGIFK